MTQAQHDVLDKCLELLREHFEASVILVAFEVEETKNQAADMIRSGGWIQAGGLLAYGNARFERLCVDPDAEKD